MLKQLLLEILACPVCLPDEIGLKTGIMTQQREDIIEGRLTCPRCGGVYPIQEGIAFLDPPAPMQAKTASRYESTQARWRHPIHGATMGISSRVGKKICLKALFIT